MSKTDPLFNRIIHDTAEALELNSEIQQTVSEIYTSRRRPPPVEKPEELPGTRGAGNAGGRKTGAGSSPIKSLNDSKKP